MIGITESEMQLGQKNEPGRAVRKVTYLHSRISNRLCGYLVIHPQFGCDRWTF